MCVCGCVGVYGGGGVAGGGTANTYAQAFHRKHSAALSLPCNLCAEYLPVVSRALRTYRHPRACPRHRER